MGVNFPNVLAAARSAGYDGCVGMEMIPTGDPIAAIIEDACLRQSDPRNQPAQKPVCFPE